MTHQEIRALTTAQIMQAIRDIGRHPFAERFERELSARRVNLLAAIEDMENRDTLGWHGIEALAQMRNEYREMMAAWADAA